MEVKTFFWKRYALAFMEGLKIAGQTPTLKGLFNYFKCGFRWEVFWGGIVCEPWSSIGEPIKKDR